MARMKDGRDEQRGEQRAERDEPRDDMTEKSATQAMEAGGVDADSDEFVSVRLPMVEELDGGLIHYFQVHLNCNEQRAGLCRLRRSLQLAGATTSSGRPVESHADAIRYVLEQYERGFDLAQSQQARRPGRLA